MKNSVKKLVTAVSTSVALLAAGNAAAEIKIGIAGPMTGPVAQYGDMQFSGARMAIEQINKNGGVMGEELVGVEYDDVCDPKQAVSVANSLVNDGVRFVVGHLCSSSTQPASDIYEDEGVLMITPASTSPAITERGYELVFRTIDGQKPIRGHGGPDMPVWGDVFARSRDGGDPEKVRTLIQSLVDYLESVQSRPVH